LLAVPVVVGDKVVAKVDGVVAVKVVDNRGVALVDKVAVVDGVAVDTEQQQQQQTMQQKELVIKMLL
uniref:Lipoyl-binding domain-containing protein n=1 Tax=Gongylonema pulchrum TaxID=637853 RepID=A0A183E5R2_9BILA